MDKPSVPINDQTITISSTEMRLFDLEECNIDEDIDINQIKKYEKSDKKIIASRIEQIRNKKIYLKLFEIISIDNNNYTSNANGVFLNLNNLQDKTLHKIEKVLNKYDEIKKNKIRDNKWNNLLQTQYNSQNNELFNDNKYTNHEKMFIKRQQSNTDNKDITYWGTNSLSKQTFNCFCAVKNDLCKTSKCNNN